MAHRILLVEDDLHTRRILKTLLMTEAVLSKAELVEAGDGNMALAQFDRGKIHLVVTDLMMPGMDGYEFCRRLRAHPNGKNVPILITSSAVKTPREIEALKQEHNADFFAKPFEVRAIVRAMLRALSEGTRQTPKAAAPATPAPVAAAPAASTSAAATPPPPGPPPPAPPSAAAAQRIVAAARVGKLASESPAALLLDACEQRTTGTLVLLRGNMQKQIALRLGAPVAVESNLRNETLGHYLVSRGVLDDARHQEALAVARETRTQLGQILIKKGWMTEGDLLKHLGAQMKAKLIHALRWPDGDWQMFVGEPAARAMELPIDTPSVVFAGLQRSAHVDEIAPRFMGISGRIKLLPRGERFAADFERVFGPGCLTTIANATSFDQLMATGGDPVATLVQLDTLLLCQLAELQLAPASEKTTPAPIAVPLPEQPLPKAAPEQSPFSQLFEGEASGPKPGIGALEIQALRKEIATAFVDVHRKTYYAVLGIEPSASMADVTRAYQALKERFRLERFADKDLGPDYARLEELISIQERAHQTLCEPTARRAYDDSLAPKQSAAAPRIDADLFAQEASRLLAKGDPAAAAQKLVHAVALAPTEADYQALLGWATFNASGATQDARAQADVHLKEALRINPDNAPAYEYLGRMHLALGDKPRAVDALGRALDLDPRAPSALMAFEQLAQDTADWKRLELRYRKLLHRLNEPSALALQLELWLKLGDLYASKLSDVESARMAYSMMNELSPSDPRAAERLKTLG